MQSSASDGLSAAHSRCGQFKENQMKNLFIGNMSFKTTEADLRSLFEPFGVISRVNVVTDRDTGQARGFGFVEMSDDGEAQKAIASLNGKELDGRALNVNEARPKTERSGPRAR
jgi:cold-inducible RNA-binding protein